MAKLVTGRLERVRLLHFSEPHDEDEELLQLDDELAARGFLDHFVGDVGMTALRDFYLQWTWQPTLINVSDHQVLDALAQGVARGELKVVLPPIFEAAGDVGEQPEPEEPPVGPATEVEHWVKFKVVDDETGEPVPGVTLLIREPSGLEREYETRPDGMIEIDPVDPGTCDILRMTDEDALEVVRVE